MMTASEKKIDWTPYFACVRDKGPAPLLVQALSYPLPGKTALDAGAGVLKDTRHLLAAGFDVVAFDADPAIARAALEISAPRLHHQVATFENFDFKPQSVDLIVALLALPFCPPAFFDAVFQRMIRALKPGGIFCGHLFGPRDDWNTKACDMTFHTAPEARALFKDFDLLSFTEAEADNPIAGGGSKHYHAFEIIARLGVNGVTA